MATSQGGGNFCLPCNYCNNNHTRRESEVCARKSEDGTNPENLVHVFKDPYIPEVSLF